VVLIMDEKYVQVISLITGKTPPEKGNEIRKTHGKGWIYADI
jgi:hypothetical protein